MLYLDVNSAAMRSLLYSSVREVFFLEKKSISRVTEEMQDRSKLKEWGDTWKSKHLYKINTGKV